VQVALRQAVPSKRFVDMKIHDTFNGYIDDMLSRCDSDNQSRLIERSIHDVSPSRIRKLRMDVIVIATVEENVQRRIQGRRGSAPERFTEPRAPGFARMAKPWQRGVCLAFFRAEYAGPCTVEGESLESGTGALWGVRGYVARPGSCEWAASLGLSVVVRSVIARRKGIHKDSGNSSLHR